MTRENARAHIQRHARMLEGHARARRAEREKLRRDPMVPRESMSEVLRQFDERTAAERRVMVEAALAPLPAYREANVLKRPPDFRPASAALASWYAAKASLASGYSPAVLARELKDAIATGDTTMVALLTPYAESVSTYKKPFTEGSVAAAVIDAKAFLDNVPEVVASREAAEWADTVEGEVRYLDGILGQAEPIQRLDLTLSTNALPHILPTSAT